MRPGVVQPPRGRHQASGDAQGRELGAVPPRPPRQQHPERLGEGLAGVDHHHRLKAAAPREARLPAHLAVCAHAGLREPSERV